MMLATMADNLNASFMNKMTDPLKTLNSEGKDRKKIPLQEDYLTMSHQMRDHPQLLVTQE